MKQQRICGLTTVVLALLAWGLYAAGTAAQKAPGVGAAEQTRPQSASPAGPAVCGQMSTVPSPNVGSGANYLTGVSARTSNDVWAVGSYANSSGIPQTLVEHWNGTAWALVPSSNIGTGHNVLNGVSALASNDVWAVGYYYDDGTRYDEALVEHWDGSAWSVVTSLIGGDSATLSGVSARASNDVWAVGEQLNGAPQPLVGHWNGTTWSGVISPSPGGVSILNGVSARASNDVWAVGVDRGSTDQTLVEHWDGAAWAVVASSNVGSGNNFLGGVAAVANGDVWAVGDYATGSVYQNLVEHWNGSAWAVVATPNLGTGDGLGGVSALVSNDVWAVGDYGNSSGRTQTLVEHWNGTAWALVPSANIGTGDSYLVGVVALPSGDVWAVGADGTPGQTLVEHDGGPCGTPTPAASPPPCSSGFSDVHPTDYFYTPVLYLACHGVISGYADGTFRPNANTTRSQQVKIVVLGFAKAIHTPPAGVYTFADVPPSQPFFAVIETAAAAHIISGYACGGVGEPCDSAQRPYFRPFAAVTRGQLAKMDVLAAGWPLLDPATGKYADVVPAAPFYPFVETASGRGVLSGYVCGGSGEPCDSGRRPYFRAANQATRGQIAKIVYLSVTAR